jgi:hypothetical protein
MPSDMEVYKRGYPTMPGTGVQENARVNHTVPNPVMTAMHTRRWGREILESILDEDLYKMRNVLSYEGVNLAERVKCGPRGVPMQFNGYGEFLFSFATCPIQVAR